MHIKGQRDKIQSKVMDKMTPRELFYSPRPNLFRKHTNETSLSMGSRKKLITK